MSLKLGITVKKKKQKTNSQTNTYASVTNLSKEDGSRTFKCLEAFFLIPSFPATMIIIITILRLGSLFICLLFVCFMLFLGPHLRHMEVPRLGVKTELQLLAYTTAHSNAVSLTH